MNENDSFMMFFRNRTQDRGRVWMVSLERPEGNAQLLFHSKSYLEQNAYLPTITRADIDKYPRYKSRLETAIRDSGGGVMIEVTQSEGRLLAEIRTVDAREKDAYLPAPPRRLRRFVDSHPILVPAALSSACIAEVVVIILITGPALAKLFQGMPIAVPVAECSPRAITQPVPERAGAKSK